MLKRLTAGQKWVVLVIGLTLALSVFNLGRAITALQYASSLPDLSTTAPLGYFAAMGGFWGIVFVVCTVGLSGFSDWARWTTLVAVTLYQVNVWINHLLFHASDYARQATPRNLVLTAIMLLVYWGPLNLPPARRVFERSEGQEVPGAQPRSGSESRLDNPREQE